MALGRRRKVGILTLPFNGNYGGMIQAVALYSFLKENGVDPVLIRKAPLRTLRRRITLWLKERIPGPSRRRLLAQVQHENFLAYAMPRRTQYLYCQSSLALAVSDMDAVVVGSDQVWRDYNRDKNFLNYFLDFVPNGVLRIAYAASFGASQWTMPALTDAVTQLLQRFALVSVREDTGVLICREILGCSDAQQTLDPTLLLDATAYEHMIPASNRALDRILLNYVLDENDAMNSVQARLIEENGLTIRKIENGERGEHVISLPEWLRAFRDCEWVVTDSFHGMVFAIIFRKSFYAFGNRKRGLDRFTSLLALLGLLDRLIMDERAPDSLRPVDYGPVEVKLAVSRQSSIKLLLQAIHGRRRVSG